MTTNMIVMIGYEYRIRDGRPYWVWGEGTDDETWIADEDIRARAQEPVTIWGLPVTMTDNLPKPEPLIFDDWSRWMPEEEGASESS